ncbi:MAG TPA: phosphatase PAP2 family protein [Candidatus Nanopelagicales bacterium]
MSGDEAPAAGEGRDGLVLGQDPAPHEVVRAVVTVRLLRASLGCTAVFLVLSAAISAGSAWLAGFDSRWSTQFFSFAVDHTGLQPVVRLATALGNGWTVTLVTTAAVIWCATRRSWALGLWLVAVVAGSAVLSTLVKNGFSRARPATEGLLASAHGFSFPSGHSQAATVTYSAVVLVVGWQLARPGPLARRVSAALVVVVVGAVGLSRILLGVHWPTDVLGGWLLGSAWVTAATYILLRYVLPGDARSAPSDPSTDPGAETPE